MNEQNMITLMRNYHLYRIELDILRDCPQTGGEANTSRNGRIDILKKRLVLVKHMMKLLNGREAAVLRLHLIEKLSWNEILELRGKNRHPELLVNDRRTLQRIQQRALEKVSRIMMNTFGDSLDFLIDADDG